MITTTIGWVYHLDLTWLGSKWGQNREHGAFCREISYITPDSEEGGRVAGRVATLLTSRLLFYTILTCAYRTCDGSKKSCLFCVYCVTGVEVEVEVEG